MTSHVPPDLLHHTLFDCLLHSLFGLDIKIITKLHVTCPLHGRILGWPMNVIHGCIEFWCSLCLYLSASQTFRQCIWSHPLPWHWVFYTCKANLYFDDDILKHYRHFHILHAKYHWDSFESIQPGDRPNCLRFQMCNQFKQSAYETWWWYRQ